MKKLFLFTFLGFWVIGCNYYDQSQMQKDAETYINSFADIEDDSILSTMEM